MKQVLHRLITLVFIHIVLIFQGCGLRPVPVIPREVTIPRVLAAIEKYSGRIRDFSGRAHVKLLGAGQSQSATVHVRYINPDRFRIYVKGFAGIDLARITALKDSMIIYIPSENVYITAERYENILGILLPDVNIDVNSFESAIIGSLPPPEDRENYQMSVEYSERQAELTLKKGEIVYRYVVKGPELRLVSEEMLFDTDLVWRKTISAYTSVDGVYFPDEVIIEHSHQVFSVNFSKCRINSGLTERDLLFTIPASAERAFIEQQL